MRIAECMRLRYGLPITCTHRNGGRGQILLSRRARARRTDGAPKIIWREIAAYASASKKLATDDDDETTNDGTPTTRGGNPGALVNLFEG